jgi:hypothetical protein
MMTTTVVLDRTDSPDPNQYVFTGDYHVVVQLPEQVWLDLEEPDRITVQIAPGDTLNT